MSLECRGPAQYLETHHVTIPFEEIKLKVCKISTEILPFLAENYCLSGASGKHSDEISVRICLLCISLAVSFHICGPSYSF